MKWVKIDRAILKKLEARVKRVVIIFGFLHHRHLSRLIQQSDMLQLDPSSKGGHRLRKTKRNPKPMTRRKRRIYK